MANAPADRVAALLWPMDAPVNVWNTTGAPPIAMTYQFAGTSQPADLWVGFDGWTAFTATQRTAMQSVIAEFASIINVTFSEAPASADPDINLARVNLNGGLGGFQYSYSTLGNTVVSRELDGFAAFDNTIDLALAGSRNLLLHEFGHALTLKHAGNYDAGGTPQPAPFLPAAEDNNKYSVMSYNGNPDNGLLESDHLMLYDIAALQARFGANMNTRTGNDSYGITGDIMRCIWDAAGIDTISANGFASAVTIDLREGAFSTLGAVNNLSIAYGCVIENATGGNGGDTLHGNDIGNTLLGGSGNDTLNGNGGNDILDGGIGTDTLNGGTGVDVLDGRSGGDTMNGGADADTYYWDNALDQIIELAGGGTDQIRSFVSLDMGASAGLQQVERGYTYGTANITIFGNALHNVLGGNGGNNRLEGRGGLDLIDGGAGNDTIIGGADRDTMTGGAGRDLFRLSFITETGNAAGARDVITDFTADALTRANASSDILDFAAIDADTTSGGHSFSFIGTDVAFSAAGQLRARTEGGNTIIEGNVDATLSSDFQIQLNGIKSLLAADFIL